MTHIGISIYQINAEYLLNEKPPHQLLSALLQGFIGVRIYFLHCLVRREAELALFCLFSRFGCERVMCSLQWIFFAYGRQFA